jgi:hypothetical protein
VKVKKRQIPPEDLKKLIAFLHSIGNPKEIQAFIQYFYGKKLNLTFINSILTHIPPHGLEVMLLG